MSCCCNDVSVLNRVVEQTCSDKTCWVSHINHEKSTYLISNLTHTSVIPLTAVSRTTTDDELWLVLLSELLHLVIVNTTSLLVEVVTYRLVEDTRCVNE